ncbi:cell division protein ZapA [Cupriavidus alkaliphilus]|uniref:cell division protein ZapA n=1 Tax=Cupriavidus alkaliphilus TaxID=942866 RepID=UPI00339D5B30
MDLLVSISLQAPEFRGGRGPAEAAHRLRQIADEIEANVTDFSTCPEGQRIAGSQEDCSSVAYLVEL